MNERNEIEIEVNVSNPVEYLACCGIFEIASRFDENAQAHWRIDGATAFVLDTALSEPELLEILIPTLTDWEKWKVGRSSAGEVTHLEATFSKAQIQIEKIVLDWWYESLKPSGEINKSGWKMYAGQQKAEKISLDMVQKCQHLACGSLTDVLRQTRKVSGSFGFDPAASRNALDVGYSPNDLNLPVVTSPFSQLLAMFGAQNFFPSRTLHSADIVSSRGWTKDNRKYFFDYALWLVPVPIALARSFANGSAGSTTKKILKFRSPRASRDKYSNLTLATPTN